MKSDILIILLAILATSCHYSNRHGECIGLLDDGDPTLTYKVDTWNAVWTLVGSESIVPPVIWALECVSCPTGKKK